MRMLADVKCLISAVVLLVVSTGAARAVKPIDAKLAEKIRQAAPDKPPAQPQGRRKILVYSNATGFKHSVIPVAARAFQILGDKSGAYQAVLSSDPAAFEPENLKQFDAIVLNNTTGDLLMPTGQELEDKTQAEKDSLQAAARRRRQALLDFVRSGKGLVGTHAATDSAYGWTEYGRMIGGYFDGHPWNARTTVTVKIDQPDHPVNKAFGGESIRITDEIYQFGPGKAGWDPYSRTTHRVLLSLDLDKSPRKRGMKRKDNDYAISWVKPYGKGRVFYCSLGHNHAVFTRPAILGHYLAGIQYALGDLSADDSPSQPAN